MKFEGVFHPHLPEGSGSYPIEVSDERGLAPPLFSNDPNDWESWSF